MEGLSKNIRFLRHRRGWSQGDFASQLGISVPAFSKIELGVTDITLSRLQQIAKVLDMTPMELLYYNQVTEEKDTDKLDTANEAIKLHVSEILDLQKQVIVLHEEIRRLNKVVNSKI